jgi:hypothetical protein
VEESAEDYVEWHTFMLWVRTVVESTGQISEAVRSELRARCPGFVDANESTKHQPIWKLLEDWIAAEVFAHAKAGGWFSAVLYYAHKDLRIEQAWTFRERAKAGWHGRSPGGWPTFDQWKRGVATTYELAHGGTERARAAAALEKVDRNRLESAVANLLEFRGLAFWVDCVSRTDQPVGATVLAEIEKRCPSAMDVAAAGLLWHEPVLWRLIRRFERESRETARREGWYAALRYYVANHPRYQRLAHYRQRCHDEWLSIRPISLPSFPQWLALADAYCVPQHV